MTIITKNVPIPKDLRGRPCKYPWYHMDVNDSFLMPPGTTTLQAHTACNNVNSRHDLKFRAVKQADGRYRIWRIK